MAEITKEVKYGGKSIVLDCVAIGDFSTISFFNHLPLTSRPSASHSSLFSSLVLLLRFARMILKAIPPPLQLSPVQLSSLLHYQVLLAKKEGGLAAADRGKFAPAKSW